MMRRPRKTPPSAVWESGLYHVELHRQKAGWVLWAHHKFEGDFEWSAFEDRADAVAAVTDYYGIPTSAHHVLDSMQTPTEEK
jgi:hypothetical protein